MIVVSREELAVRELIVRVGLQHGVGPRGMLLNVPSGRGGFPTWWQILGNDEVGGWGNYWQYDLDYRNRDKDCFPYVRFVLVGLRVHGVSD